MAEMSIEDPMQLCNFLQMTPSSFEELLVKIGPHIAKQTTNMRDSISIPSKSGLVWAHQECRTNHVRAAEKKGS